MKLAGCLERTSFTWITRVKTFPSREMWPGKMFHIIPGKRAMLKGLETIPCTHTHICSHALTLSHPSSTVGSRRSSALLQNPALCSKEMQQTFKYFQTKQDILKDSPSVASLSAYICVFKNQKQGRNRQSHPKQEQKGAVKEKGEKG